MEKIPCGLRAALIDHFEKGDKICGEKLLGVEVEHFIVDRGTQKALPYAGERGVRAVLEKMLARCPSAKPIISEDLLGFDTEEYHITLEPAAQLEISIEPRERIAEIGAIYRAFRKMLDECAAELDAEALTVGCQPASPARSLELIPKERYRLMNRHFEGTGTGGVEMMRATASTQISVDYASERDFSEKIKVICLMSPLFQMLNDNTPVYAGEVQVKPLKREDIWRRVDANRCGIPPKVFSENYGFADYADFLCGMPVIFRTRNGVPEPTGMMPAREVYAKECVTKENVEHVLSMAFPLVRLKKYLEIRGADSVPEDRMLAYCALVKGLLYCEHAKQYCFDFIREHAVTEEDVYAAQDSLMEHGWDGSLYGVPARIFAQKALELAEASLPEDERSYLAPYKERTEA